MLTEEQIVRKIEAILQNMKVENDRLSEIVAADHLSLAMIGLPGNVLHSFLLHMAATIYTLCRKDWWKLAFGKDELSEQDHKALRDLEGLNKHAFLVFFLARIEWNLRVLASHRWPSKGIKNSKYKNLYEHINDEFGTNNWNDLLSLGRLLRNTIHNNGRYIDRDSNDVMVQWKGTSYTFEHAKPITFLTSEIFIHLLDEHWRYVKELISTPTYLALGHVPKSMSA